MNTEISESDQLYSNIFESAPDGLIITDLRTVRVLEANPAACVMCERTEAVDALLTITSQAMGPN
jgi:PAS domain-containing protein